MPLFPLAGLGRGPEATLRSVAGCQLDRVLAGWLSPTFSCQPLRRYCRNRSSVTCLAILRLSARWSITFSESIALLSRPSLRVIPCGGDNNHAARQYVSVDTFVCYLIHGSL
jgi:hypothetical protein